MLALRSFTFPHNSLQLLLLLLTICQGPFGVHGRSLSVVFNRNPNGGIEPNISLSGPMQEVQIMLIGMEKLSSCNKIATAHLLESCSSLPDANDPRSPDMVLDKPKKIYVARLALCEISEAPDTKWPPGCVGLDLIHRNSAISQEAVDECVNALYFANNNMWTSYSSSKKHAAGICRSVRSEIEKDEQIKIFEMLFNATTSVTSELKNAKQEIVAVQDAFALLRGGLYQFLKDVANQYTDILSSGQRNWNEIEIQIRNVSNEIDNLVTQIQAVSQNLANHDDQLEALKTKAETHHHTELSRFSEIINLSNDQFSLALQLVLDGVHKVGSETANSLELANQLSTEFVDRLSEQYTMLESTNEAYRDISQAMTDLRDIVGLIKLEQLSTHMELQAEANRTKAALMSLPTWLNLLPPSALRPEALCAFSISFFISFAFWRDYTGLSLSSAVALSTACNLAFWVMIMNSTRGELLRNLKPIEVSERVIWACIVVVSLAVSTLRNLKYSSSSRWTRILRHSLRRPRDSSKTGETAQRMEPALPMTI